MFSASKYVSLPFPGTVPHEAASFSGGKSNATYCAVEVIFSILELGVSNPLIIFPSKILFGKVASVTILLYCTERGNYGK